MKTFIGLALILILLFLSKAAFALRCGNELIETNQPLHEVTNACGGGHEYRVQNQNADIVKYYYKEGGMNHEMTFVDGELKNVESSRF
jgi:hypothetical protein